MAGLADQISRRAPHPYPYHAPARPPPCRDILAVPETRADWWRLYDRHLKQRLAAGTLRLSLVNSDDLPPLGGAGGG